MIRPAFAVTPGDMIRYGTDPLYRTVEYAHERGDGMVEIEVAAGGLLEKLPLLPKNTPIEVDSSW